MSRDPDRQMVWASIVAARTHDWDSDTDPGFDRDEATESANLLEHASRKAILLLDRATRRRGVVVIRQDNWSKGYDAKVQPIPIPIRPADRRLAGQPTGSSTTGAASFSPLTD